LLAITPKNVLQNCAEKVNIQREEKCYFATKKGKSGKGFFNF
jgi:hypothetical protein